MFAGLFCFFKFDLKVDSDGERRHSSSRWEKGFDHQLRPAVYVTNIVGVPKTVGCGSSYTCWNKSRKIRRTRGRIHFVKEDKFVFSSSLL